MQNLFVLAKLLYEFFDAVFVKKRLLLCRVGTLVCKCDFEAGIKKCQLAQPRSETFELKLDRNCKNGRIRQERDKRTGSLLVFYLADDSEFVGRFPFGESHVIDLPSRDTSALNHSESAFVHFAPTPCKPPEYLYAPCPNFPPACKFVSTSSTAGIFHLGWISVGIPRPLSRTEIDPST